MKDQPNPPYSFRDKLYGSSIEDFNIAIKAMFSSAHYPCLMILLQSVKEDDDRLFLEYTKINKLRHYDELYHTYLQNNSVIIKNFYLWLMYVQEGKVIINENADNIFLSIIKTLEKVCCRYEHKRGYITILETAKKYQLSLFTILLYIVRKIYFTHKLIIFNQKQN